VRVLTADGAIELKRPYFWGKDQGGVCPADDPVGIEAGRTSPGAREILCRLGMVQDFGQAADDARRIGNIPVCKEKLRQIAEREAANITRGRNDGTIRAAWTSADAQVKIDPGAPRLTRVYAGVDGVMAPIVTAAEKEKRRKNQVIRRQQRLQTGIGNASPSFFQRIITNISCSHSESGAIRPTSASSPIFRGETGRFAMQCAVKGK